MAQKLTGGVVMDVNKNTIEGFANENPFLNQNIGLRNTVDKFDAAGGIRGTFAANIGFKAMISYQTLNDYAYFVNNIDHPQKFDIAYFNGNMNVLGFTGELNIDFTDAFNLDSKLSLKQYDNQAEQYAWLHPALVLTSNASFKM